jgi:peptidoglycan/LPS O-acetylase OafA/YrhL
MPAYPNCRVTVWQDAEVPESAPPDSAALGVPHLSPPRTPADLPRTRLAGLDGIRGLAALFVVVNHIFLRAFPGYPVDSAPFWAAWFIYGRFAVVVFIVLSGFSLALSPARSGWQLAGISRFAHRRAERILPAYWAALVFSLLVAWLILPQPGQGVPNAKSVLVHGLLLQDLFDVRSPNRAFWTIAIEAQLYVVFPLLLLTIRRVNAIAMVAAVTLVVATVDILGSHFSQLNGLLARSSPDLTALFAVGVMAAGILTTTQRRRSWPWHWLALAAAFPVIATISAKGSVWTNDHLFWVDLALGPSIGCLLAALATDRPAALVHALDTRPLRSLGSFSYSLYLTHAPIVVVLYEEIVAGRVRQGVPSFLVSLVIVVPVTIVFARIFAAAFEVPFRTGRETARQDRYRRPMRADATFTVESFVPVELMPLPTVSTGTPVGVATIEKQFIGDVVGRSTTLFTAAYEQATGVGTYVAMESFEGALRGRHGAFNFAHSATTSGSDRTAEFFTIVPSSGTGELVGVSGAGGMAIDADGTHRIWFDYELG